MNWRTLPDCPEHLKHWSGHDPANPPIDDEELLDMLCDCGHRSFEEEVTEIEGRSYCVNCVESFGVQNTDHVGDLEVKETGETGVKK